MLALSPRECKPGRAPRPRSGPVHRLAARRPRGRANSATGTSGGSAPRGPPGRPRRRPGGAGTGRPGGAGPARSATTAPSTAPRRSTGAPAPAPRPVPGDLPLHHEVGADEPAAGSSSRRWRIAAVRPNGGFATTRYGLRGSGTSRTSACNTVTFEPAVEPPGEASAERRVELDREDGRARAASAAVSTPVPAPRSTTRSSRADAGVRDEAGGELLATEEVLPERRPLGRSPGHGSPCSLPLRPPVLYRLSTRGTARTCGLRLVVMSGQPTTTGRGGARHFL